MMSELELNENQKVKSNEGNKKKNKQKLGSGGQLKEQKKQKKLEALGDDFTVDNFDRTVLLDQNRDICAMCKQGHDFGVLLKSKCRNPEEEQLNQEEFANNLAQPDHILDVNGVWASKYSLNFKKRTFVHFDCASFSPRTWFTGTSWNNLAKEVSRGNFLKCKKCEKGGATLGCSELRCKVVMHIPCAVVMGFQVTRYKDGYLCVDHDKNNIKNRIKTMPAPRSADLSRGREIIPVAVVASNSGAEERLFDDFKYCKDVVDSDTVQINARFVEDVACCTCDGMCFDVNECACLQGGKNYTYGGQLIPGVKNEIFECNLRCSCSVRRCTNRVVERGITFPLQVFSVRQVSRPGNGENDHTTDHTAPPITNSASQLPADSSQMNNAPSNQVPSSSSGHNNSNSNSNGKPAAVKVVSVWGVRTLEDIPAHSFVCILGGQLVRGDSSLRADLNNTSNSNGNSNGNSNSNSIGDSNTHSSGPMEVSDAEAEPIAVWEHLLHQSDHDRARKVVPLSQWEQGVDLSPAQWAAQALRQQHNKDVNNINGSDGDTVPSNCISSSNSSSISDSTGHLSSSVQEPAGGSTVSSEEKEDGYQPSAEDVRSFLKGQTCLDCRYFGNVGSFIRRRAAKDSSPAERMLETRLVFTNKKDTRFPKLALFAVRNIPANTELLI